MSLSTNRLAYSIPMSYQALHYLDQKVFSDELEGRPEGLYYRILYGIGRHACFRLLPLKDGIPQAYTPESLTITPGGFTLRLGEDYLLLTFSGEDVLTVSGYGLGLRFEMMPKQYEYAAVQDDTHVLVNTSAARAQYMLTAARGTMRVDAPYGTECCLYIHCDFIPDAAGRMEMFSEQFEKLWKPAGKTPHAEESMKENLQDFEQFANKFPACDAKYERARTEALFILWSAIVGPCRYVKRRGIFCSNNWMLGVWTWDSAIISMGVSLGDRSLALDLLNFPFDVQTPEGLLPDYVNPSEQMWNFTKPPVHGIALQNFFLEWLSDMQLLELREKLSRQVSYFENYTDSDHDGVYQYNHGNDCGWDNCTPFEVGASVEGPDLNAYLILEMHALSNISLRLGNDADAERWKQKAEDLQERLICHSWDGERFHVYQSRTHRESSHGDSLYNYLPICLGHHLPKSIFEKLVSDIKEPGRFLTAHGLATESLRSECYESDGYWRGPIWAPTMLLIIMGIADGGDRAFAAELARRFCDTCLENGFAENYDAMTGKALRDPSFAWTASVFIVLYSQYLYE